MNCLLSLGTNQGQKTANIKKALALITELESTKVILSSKIVETEPYGFSCQSRFLNCIIEIMTSLSPLTLLTETKKIEQEMGRFRDSENRWGPRVIDIDILFYEQYIVNIDFPELIIPHYDLHNRLFILEILKDYWPDFQHPVFKRTVEEIYQDLNHKLDNQTERNKNI